MNRLTHGAVAFWRAKPYEWAHIMSNQYKKAGVDIDAGDQLVREIRSAIEATHTPEVCGHYGGYGALFSLAKLGADKVHLVSATDGVGTKLQLTKETGYWDRIGQDLVAMCANDILCLGARPLFFLDYYATGTLEVGIAAKIIRGIADACKTISCALIGGETAEMPGVYRTGDFDMAGFIVGWVHEDTVLDASKIQVGDKVLGLASSGFHSNGYSLVRHIIQEQHLDLEQIIPGEKKALGDLLTQPTLLYGPTLEPFLATDSIHGMAHITGGGLTGNLPRILPDSCGISLSRTRWKRPPLFDFFQEIGNIPDEEMVRVFNDGIGMVLIVPDNQANEITSQLEETGETVWDLGEIESRKPDEAAVTLA